MVVVVLEILHIDRKRWAGLKRAIVRMQRMMVAMLSSLTEIIYRASRGYLKIFICML